MGNALHLMLEHFDPSILDWIILSCRAAIVYYLHYRQQPDHSFIVRAFLLIARFLVAAKLLNIPNSNGKKMMRITMDESSTHLYERTYQQFLDNHRQPNTIDWVLMFNRVIQTMMTAHRGELVNISDLINPLMFMVRFLLTADPYEGQLNPANIELNDNIFTIISKLWEYYQGASVPILVAVDN